MSEAPQMESLAHGAFVTAELSVAGRKPGTRRAENQDRVLCRQVEVGNGLGVLLAVADGITNCPYGGSVANWVVERHLKTDAIPFTNDQTPARSLLNYLEQLYDRFKAEFSSSQHEGFLDSGAALSVVLLHDNMADCLWAGDCFIYVSRRASRGYQTELLNRPDRAPDGRLTECFGAHAPFCLKTVTLPMSAGDTLTITSDGVTVDENTISRIYASKGVTSAAIQEMVRLSSRGRYWDDLSLVAAQRR